MEERTQAELNLEERKRVSRETIAHSTDKVQVFCDVFFWLVCSCGIVLFAISSTAYEDTLRNNQFQTAVKRADLVVEITKNGATKYKVCVTTEQGIFSVDHNGNQYLLLLESEDRVTISYYKKATKGPTEAAYIRVDDSSNPNIVIEKGD